MTERWTYSDIKMGIFRSMYKARQNIVYDKRSWFHPIEDVGVAYHDDCPDEGIPAMPDLFWLMDKTIYLILCAGLSPEPGFTNANEKIRSILADSSIEELLKDIPEQEAYDLRYDLEILGFIPPDITKPQRG
jgi:hypothetical protein